MEKQLPKNWVECNLESIVERMTNGVNLSQREEAFENSYPITRIETIANETINLERVKYVQATDDQIQKYSLRDGDILFSHINSDKHLGKTAIYKSDEVLIHGINLLLIRTIKHYNPYLLNYFLRFYRFEGKFMEVAQRAVNQSSINQKKLNTFNFPLPPLAEQNRIVAKLDSLFAQLEMMKTSMAAIPVLLKNFRKQVLTQAVTGKLTESWSVGKELEEWKVVSSSSLFEFITSGSRGWAQFYNQDGDQLFVRITNMNYGTSTLDLSPTKLQFLKLPSNNSEGKRTLLKARDILISITADIGIISLIPSNFPYEAYVNQHICLARPDKNINEKYLVNYLMSEKGLGQLKEKKRGATKAGLTLGDIRDLNIDLPPLKEQQEIVFRVESLFTKAATIERQYKTLKEKIDNLPQAMLHKAFKGELVKQLDTDGDARELLKEIQELRTQTAAAGKKKVVKKKVKVYKDGVGELGMVAERKENVIDLK